MCALVFGHECADSSSGVNQPVRGAEKKTGQQQKMKAIYQDEMKAIYQQKMKAIYQQKMKAIYQDEMTE